MNPPVTPPSVPPATPKISRPSRFPVVWLVPLLALAIGGWMVFREMRNRGPEIKIHFPNGAGLQAGRTELIHKGVTVGTVRKVALDESLEGVEVTLQLAKDAEAFARAGSEFWIVRPEVSLTGVRGLETLLGGVHLNAQPGTGEVTSEFRGLDRQPAPENTRAGRAFVLRASKLGSLSTGAPVYYREIKVGMVEASRLADDAAEVLIRVRIFKPYIDLVRGDSQFWNAGGATFKASLLGAEFKSTSLEALFSGGIAFATPDGGKNGLAPVAPDGAQFVLHDEADKDWLKWQPRIPISPVDSEPTPAARPSDMTGLPTKGP